MVGRLAAEGFGVFGSGGQVGGGGAPGRVGVGRRVCASGRGCSVGGFGVTGRGCSVGCGDELLDRWLVRYARQNQSRDSARAFVAANDDGHVYGYYTLLAGKLDHDEATP